MAANPEKNYMIGQLLDVYGALLSDRQREVCDLYYNDDLSLAEVSEECGITRQGVRDALLKAEEQLNSFETRLGLLQRQRENEKIRTELLAGLKKLEEQGNDVSALAETVKALSF